MVTGQTHTPVTQAVTPSTSAQFTAVTDAHLAWPTFGQAAVADVDDKLLARSTDHEEQQPTASMAKVIAALAVMQKQPLTPNEQGPVYTVTQQDIQNLTTYVAEDGSVLPMRIGQQMTEYEALQRMLIASDNNTADMLTERVFGSKQAYVAYAQDMVQRMGLSQTVVTDASGFSAATVSTPSDLVRLGIAALNDPVLAAIVSEPWADIPDVGAVSNTNQLLSDDGVVGIKTGTTDEAGSCLLFAARYTNTDGTSKTLVGVIMGDTDHDQLYADSRALLASARQQFGLDTARSLQ